MTLARGGTLFKKHVGHGLMAGCLVTPNFTGAITFTDGSSLMLVATVHRRRHDPLFL